MTPFQQTTAKAWAFFRRDALNDITYKMGFVTQLIGLGSGILSIYFLSRIIDSGASNAMGAYQGAYFAFALTGLAVADAMSIALERRRDLEPDAIEQRIA